MGFPRPIPLDSAVIAARKARTAAILRASSIGIAVRLLIVSLLLVGFFAYNSVTLLFDSLATLADVISSLVLIFSIRLLKWLHNDAISSNIKT